MVLKNIVVLSNADWGSDYLDELLVMLNSLEYDKDNQVGGIGVYEVSSELGIDDYLTKPLHAFIVKETIHGIVNSWNSRI